MYPPTSRLCVCCVPVPVGRRPRNTWCDPQSIIVASISKYHHFVWCFVCSVCLSASFFVLGGERETRTKALGFIVAANRVRSQMNYIRFVGCLFLIKCDVLSRFLWILFALTLTIHRHIVIVPLPLPLQLLSLPLLLLCAKRTFIINKSEKEKLRKNNGYMSCLIHLMIIICTAINIIVVIY